MLDTRPRPPPTRCSTGPGWSEEQAAAVGIRVDQLPRLVPTGWECGAGRRCDGPVLAGGCIDALADQIVAGADNDGDVLVLLGTTLIVWAVTTRHDAGAGLLGRSRTPRRTSSSSVARATRAASSCNWATGLLARRVRPRTEIDARPGPVWAPYPRGERVAAHDPTAGRVLADLDLTHDAAALRRAAFEASGFVARRMHRRRGRDARHHAAAHRRDRRRHARRRVGAGPRRLHRAPGRVRRGAEGGALGSAFLARSRAGLGSPSAMPDGPALGPERAHGRARSGVGRRGRRRALSTLPGRSLTT